MTTKKRDGYRVYIYRRERKKERTRREERRARADPKRAATTRERRRDTAPIPARDPTAAGPESERAPSRRRRSVDLKRRYPVHAAYLQPHLSASLYNTCLYDRSFLSAAFGYSFFTALHGSSRSLCVYIYERGVRERGYRGRAIISRVDFYFIFDEKRNQGGRDFA